jgi:hypothetical protein
VDGVGRVRTSYITFSFVPPGMNWALFGFLAWVA